MCGHRMLLTRFKHCNRADKPEEGGMGKKCLFCDTSILMRNTTESEYTLSQLQEVLDSEKLIGMLVTGGEPGHNLNLNQTVLMLNKLNYKISNVETNGCNLSKMISLVNKNKKVYYSFSPKLFDDNDFEFSTNLVEEIKNNEDVYIKLVYTDSELDNKFLDYITNINFSNHRLFLMPEGTTREKLIENSPKVFDACEKYKCNFSSREHIIYNFI